MDPKEKRNVTFKNIVAISIFILLLGIGVWSAVQVIRFVPRLFSTTGVMPVQTTSTNPSAKDVTITLSLDKRTVESGEKLTISWPSVSGTDGFISFSYECTDGLSFQTDGAFIPCNSPYVLNRTNSKLTVVPSSTKKIITAPFAITYTDTENKSIRATQTIIVTNATIISPKQPTPNPTTTDRPIEPTSVTYPNKTIIPTKRHITQPTQRIIRVQLVSNPYGTPDLKVTMIAVGDINQYGLFQPTQVVRQYSRGAAKFRVTNIGTKTTGPWLFSAVLPSKGAYPYISKIQPPLLPGSTADILITFDQLIPGTYSFNVKVDPYNYIPESNEFNNTTGQTITVVKY